MKILIIGGTHFLGRALVDAAVEDAHQITLFNRGITSPNLFPEIEHIQGDRTQDIANLQGQKWDCVIDTCGYIPDDLQISASVLKNCVDQYIFISSCSVYDFEQPTDSFDESAPPLLMPPDENPNDRSLENYGAKKYLCEQVVQDLFGKQSLIIRPGLIVGPHDSTYRFPYWPERFLAGGEMLVPDCLNNPVQIIDVRDLAKWTLLLATNAICGIFNATGPQHPMALGEFFKTCLSTLESNGTLTPVSEAFLKKHDVNHWVGLPLWLQEDSLGLFKLNYNKAIQAGLQFRPISETIQNTLSWSINHQIEGFRSKAISRKTEGNLLELWASESQ